MYYYILVGISSLMFGVQFLFNKVYQTKEGASVWKSVLFALGTSIVMALLMLIIQKGQIRFSWFSMLLASLAAIAGIAFVCFSAFAFERVNLSMYSLFSMLGGMLLPVICGVAFYGEVATVKTGVCVVIIIAALLLPTDFHAEKTTLLYCLAVFLLNGIGGVISKCHQSSIHAVSGGDFMFWKGVVTVALCLAMIPFLSKPKPLIASPVRSAGCMVGYGAICGLANLFVLIALLHINASVQYPMITGGTIVASTVIAFFGKDKITKKDVLAAALALGATLFLVQR